MNPPILRALGLMSGTSVDGVDVALIEPISDTADLWRVQR